MATLESNMAETKKNLVIGVIGFSSGGKGSLMEHLLPLRTGFARSPNQARNCYDRTLSLSSPVCFCAIIGDE